MKAFKLFETDKTGVVEVPLPALRPDYILVKVEAVALNPTDWKHVKNMKFPAGSPPLTVGCDFAGVVQQVGPEVTKPWKAGDRVCGFAHGANPLRPESGSFAEYLVAKGDVAVRIPDDLSFEQAATLGVQIFTAAQGLYQQLKLPFPDAPLADDKKVPILIYGGSTAMGTLGLQLAKLANLHVVTTCSPHSNALVTSYGADKIFDYRAPDVGAAIRAYTHDRLHLVWDTIGEAESPSICAAALASQAPADGLHYVALIGSGFPRDDVQVTRTLAYTVLNEDINLFGSYPVKASAEDFAFAKRWVPIVEELLSTHKIRTHPVEVREGGLEGIQQGLLDLEAGRVSGKKLVYRVGSAEK